jgi:hypothetical protein
MIDGESPVVEGEKTKKKKRKSEAVEVSPITIRQVLLN